MCQPWVLYSCNVDASFPLLFPSQELLRARSFHAQSPDCVVPFCRYRLCGCWVHARKPCSTRHHLYAALQFLHRHLGPDVPANVEQSGLTLLKRVLGTRPASSFSNCNFSPLKSVEVAACQEQATVAVGLTTACAVQ